MTLQNFQQHLEKYAKLIVIEGINVQKGHSVILQIDVEQQALAHLIVEEAYQAGADEVIVKWSDDTVQRQFFLHAADKCLDTVPASRKLEAQEWVDKKASRISVVSSDPDALAGTLPERVATFQSVMGKALMPLRQATQANINSWTVVAAAGKKWAQKVFPDLKSNEEQVDALWDAIFKATRVYTANPIQEWQTHDAYLESFADKLNNEQLDALHYTAPGTDLTIGLPENHLWEGAGSLNSRGEKFMANMPTEEVFTAPDYRRVDGFVKSTKPLSYAGTTIEGMSFTFEKGKVIRATAEKGQEVLLKLLETDAGSKFLGEVALVPDPSPISQSGITFYNTLFDENASCHLAIGSAYAFNLKGGVNMTEEELKEAGLNRSQTHVDFMIGSAQMNIAGIRKDGSTFPIFENGDWC